MVRLSVFFGWVMVIFGAACMTIGAYFRVSIVGDPYTFPYTFLPVGSFIFAAGFIRLLLAFMKSRRINRLKQTGERYKALVTKVSYGKIAVNNVYPLILECVYFDRIDRPHEVRTGWYFPNYAHSFHQLSAEAFVNPRDENDYYVEITEIKPIEYYK